MTLHEEYPWTKVYDEFEKIAYRIIDEKGLTDETCELIETEILKLYEAHITDEDYRIAYRKWCECVNE